MNRDMWTDHAACIPHHQIFVATEHPGTGNIPAPTLLARHRARAICAACPVLEQCRRDLHNTTGNWPAAWIQAGLTGTEAMLDSRQIRKWRKQPHLVRSGVADAIGTTSRALPPIRHGTDGGARAHRRRGETPCEACASAAAQVSRISKQRPRKAA